MYDVAAAAGVSHQTVSRVLNNHPNVRAETRARVLEAIASLGYRLNSAAKTLVTQRSSTIGVITSGSTLWGPSSALVAVERAARAAGYFVSVASLTDTDSTHVSETLTYFLSQSVEGIVVIAPEGALAHAADPLQAQVPVVLVAADIEPAGRVRITSVDQEAGARLATRHLIDLGHRTIAHIAGPQPWFDATARQRGWEAELRAAGLRVPLSIQGDWTAASGYHAGQRLLEKRLPTAVFASNDLMALGLIRSLHDAGVDVPRDVSVVGFDDIPGAAHFIPGLTTVRQDFEALGNQCIDILLKSMAGALNDSTPITPTLIVRESSGRHGRPRRSSD